MINVQYGHSFSHDPTNGSYVVADLEPYEETMPEPYEETMPEATPTYSSITHVL